LTLLVIITRLLSYRPKRCRSKVSKQRVRRGNTKRSKVGGGSWYAHGWNAQETPQRCTVLAVHQNLSIGASKKLLSPSAYLIASFRAQMPRTLDVAISMWDDRSTIDGVCSISRFPAFLFHVLTDMPTFDFRISPCGGSSKFAPFHAASASHTNWPDVSVANSPALPCPTRAQVRPSNSVPNDWSKTCILRHEWCMQSCTGVTC
jgi:hypothetical protein